MRKKYPKNDLGRDFICGDLHGCFKRLKQFMDSVNFDTTKDRMFSVGDLVDRGPDNEECLTLIYEPWFHAVRGNHEQMMSQYLTDSGPYGIVWGMNGGNWGKKYAKDSSDLGMLIRDAAKLTEDLPLMMTVERQDGKFFHVIHAELNSIDPLTDEDLDDEEKFRAAAFYQSMDGDFIIWGRFIFYSIYAKKMDGYAIDKFKRTAVLHKMGAMFSDKLSHIYSGHTIVQQPTRFCGQTNLDTGAYKSIWPEVLPYGKVTDVPEWAGLTVTEPLTDKFWHVSESGVREVEPLILE